MLQRTLALFIEQTGGTDIEDSGDKSTLRLGELLSELNIDRLRAQRIPYPYECGSHEGLDSIDECVPKYGGMFRRRPCKDWVGTVVTTQHARKRVGTFAQQERIPVACCALSATVVIIANPTLPLSSL